MNEPAAGLMDVVVDGPTTGKTTLLLDWLRAGEPITRYPGWTRMLVCTHARRVAIVAFEARQRHGDVPWVKCIISVRDLQMLFRGAIRAGTIEYAVDDADVLIENHLAVPQRPTLVTINGTAAYR